MSFFGFPYIVLLPAVAHGLGLERAGLGWLMACVGGGAVTAASSCRARARRRRASSPSGARSGSGSSLGLRVVDTTAATMTLVFFLGALQTMSIAALTTTIQTSVHDGMRGRVMSMVMVIFFGFSTLGGLVAGAHRRPLHRPGALATGGVVTAGGGRGTRPVADLHLGDSHMRSFVLASRSPLASLALAKPTPDRRMRRALGWRSHALLEAFLAGDSAEPAFTDSRRPRPLHRGRHVRDGRARRRTTSCSSCGTRAPTSATTGSP
jgi:hypothetical protein